MEHKFNVSGMTCAACSATVEKTVCRLDGVHAVEVNLLSGKLSVQADDRLDKESIVSAVQAAGYGIVSASEEMPIAEKKEDALQGMKKRIIWSAVFLAVLMYFTMGHMVSLPVPFWYHGTENALVAALLQLFLTIPVVFLNRSYFVRGIKSLLHRSPNMDSLIAVGSGAALISGVFAVFRMAYSAGHEQWDIVAQYSENLYFESAAMILTLITLGKFLETRAKGKTGEAIVALMDLNPKIATVRRENRELTIPVDQLVVGDIVLVRSGGAIPADGVVISGRGAVDQSALTGESIPVEKSQGDRVASATINTEGYLEIRVEKIGEDTTLAQIIRLVEQAGGSKAPIARLADRIAGVFVPVVMAIALAAFGIWLLVGETLEFALTTGIAVLVISCPCALGLATPVAIMVGTGRGARDGVLFKNAEVLENLHRVDTVVLDKTGTLTKGKPEVTDILPGDAEGNTLLQIAASLESRSEHPFAKAILMKADKMPHLAVEDFQVLPGRGVSGVIGDEKIFGGNAKLMQELGISVPKYPALESAGKTVLYFASQMRYIGAVAAADVLKEDSRQAVKQQKDLHCKVIMLTGDNQNTANSIARYAGIDHVISDVLPGDKAGAVDNLQRNGSRVLMVGDGINDAPALVTADVGMAIGTGTDIAVEAADVVLMQSSLVGVARAIELSKATIRNIKQNLFWAFFYNCVGIPIAAGVLYPAFGIQLSPMLGAAAMSLSSVFVVTNALRLRHYKTKNNVKEEAKVETIIKVNGMMCPHCKARVESVCKEIAGVQDAIVDLQKKIVAVTGSCDVNLVKQKITEAGYEVVE